MRTPEHQARPRGGKNLESELNMHYLSPGAFTVLPLDSENLPDPPPAPPPYRLPVTTKRFKHASFAIIGEASPNNSRSGSPTGRVSPFRGHGFNPSGSRHVSPTASPVPPPEGDKNNHPPSKIPKPRGTGKPDRKPSTGAVFGEKVSHMKFNKQTSRSLTNLEDRARRPPASPRKALKGAYKQLSPIQGSSPEPSQSMSSPARAPNGGKSRSTPGSRFASPTREGVNGPPRSRSKPNLPKTRDSSPVSSSPSKTPRCKKYAHVQAKINSHNTTKSKQKSGMESSDFSEDSGSPRKKVNSRKNSFNRTSSRANLLPTGKNYTSDSSVSDAVDSGRSKPRVNHNPASPVKTSTPATPKSKKEQKLPVQRKPSFKSSKQDLKQSAESSDDVVTAPSPSKKIGPQKTNLKEKARESSEERDAAPSALDVVSSTTNTVTKPLNIETPKLGRTKPVSPIIDGRVLSATSVSQAINKMNDTVLNTQTLIKDSGLNNRFSTPASAPKLESSEDEDEQENKGQLSPSKTTNKTANINLTNTHQKEPREIDPAHLKPLSPLPANHNHSNNNNHVTTIGLGHARAIEREVQNNMGRFNMGSKESSLDGTPVSKMSVNDRIREARTVIADDVKPIQIHVREKPSEVEVQSGNVGQHFGVANGINNERPRFSAKEAIFDPITQFFRGVVRSLPPSSQQQAPPEDQTTKEEPPKGRCRRFLSNFVKVVTCASCAALSYKCCPSCCKASKDGEVAERTVDGESVGCCGRLANKFKKSSNREQVRINVEDEDDPKPTCWQKLCCSSCSPCCKRNKVRDCCSLGRKKDSWSARDEDKPKCCSKEACKSFFWSVFCCGCCRRKEDLPSSAAMRKESMASSKKKSLTPTSVPPPEDKTPKIDASLVEHNSHMKAAIPVLPVWLAWFCCVMNCIGPGTGTVFSGMFCLCIGKPRFSQNDGPKPRIGAFIIDLVIGFSQFFTVLFCLVGWGWSIWWGVIMVKIARKHKKLKHLERLEEAAGKPHSLAGQNKRDAERGRT
ncbi:protein stum isoform X1 [Euwallacea fornicatus]|uniref:protein stum isoform X1 n=1 Tax=Euwallacea fornicatus TaxID=995702 RepID=UPI00338F9079